MARKIEVEIVGDTKSLERAFARGSKASAKFGADVSRSGKAARAAVPQYRALAGSYIGTTTAALALAGAAKASFSELFQSQKVAAQTEAALRSTGYAAGVSADDIDRLATSLMNVSGVDDELIKSGENLLLTFTRVRNEAGAGNDIFTQGTKAALDLSVAMGKDLQSSVILVGKALNDPIRGLTALRRVGVQFTAAQEAQIKALVKSGDAMEAQKIILRELNTEFGGSAKAAGETLPGQLNKAKESARNLGATIANILTPALIGATDSLNDMLTALQNFDDPRKGGGAAGRFFKGLLTNLPKGSEAIPTIGPFLGAIQVAFHESGKKSAEGFTEGFAEAVANSPRAEAAAARAAAAFGAAVTKPKARKQPGAATPFLDYRAAIADATKTLTDDLSVIRRVIVVLTGRLGRATTLKARTEILNALNQARAQEQGIIAELRAAKQARAAAAREARRLQAERRREAQQRAATRRENLQFGLLGLGPGGAALPPTLRNLRKSLGGISEAIKGTFLDTGKTRSVLANIRKLLAGGLGKLSADVRQAIRNILDDIDQQLREHDKKQQRTKFRIAGLDALVSGLGLTPEQERALRGRLGARGPKGEVAGGSSATAFGRPVKGPNTVTINGPVHVYGVQNKSELLKQLQKEGDRRGGSRRGSNAGAALGLS